MSEASFSEEDSQHIFGNSWECDWCGEENPADHEWCENCGLYPNGDSIEESIGESFKS